ncbi:MAG: dipeptide epimerase [Chloroflexi bacterium]|nr:dipeptide epimerase [Chloroflexota bacterium]
MTSERTRIAHLEARPLDVPLLAPFGIATGRIDHVHNVAVRVTLAGGAAGWGEVPWLPPVTAHDPPAILTAVAEIAPRLVGRDAAGWRARSAELAAWLPSAPEIRAGIEMALIDALTRAWDVPLFHFFGGASNAVTTDITIPLGSAAEAARLAAGYAARGFTTIKTKVGGVPGGGFAADRERLLAIRDAHPGCAFVLDANEGYTADEALALVHTLGDAGIVPALFEQPVTRDDWAGLARVTREAGVPVAADESCRSPADALRIARDGLAHVINIKLAKSGVVGALEIAAIARACGLGLMIGGMVETRIGMDFAAHVAAGLGGFDFIDLDTALLLAADPVIGGAASDGPTFTLDAAIAGHGGALAWD